MSKKSPPNIAVMLSGSGTTFQNLLDREKSGDLLGRLALVISDNPDAYGLKRAEKAGIEHIVLRPQIIKSEYSTQFFHVLDSRNIQLVLLAGYLKMVPVREEWNGRILNIHPALLPKFGGRGMYG